MFHVSRESMDGALWCKGRCSNFNCKKIDVSQQVCNTAGIGQWYGVLQGVDLQLWALVTLVYGWPCIRQHNTTNLLL